MFIRRIVITLFLQFLQSHAKVMTSGELGRSGTVLYWHHFPKTGGTLMRRMLYELSEQLKYNFTSSYGTENDCQLVSSCIKGKNIYITYGHALDIDTITASEVGTIVSMFRDPFSWLVSRWKHAYKFNNQKITIMEALKRYGDKYFNFLYSKSVEILRDLQYNITDRGVSRESISDSIAWRHVFHQTKQFFRTRCIVLLYDQYSKSVEHISSIMGSSLMNELFVKKYKNMSVNRAPMDLYTHKMISQLSSDTVKEVKKMLFIHYEIYNQAVLEFDRELLSTSNK